MFRTGIRAGRALALVCATLFVAASSVRAQTSALGHVPARTAYSSPVTAAAPAFRIAPGDRMFQATMKIQHYYQAAQAAPAPTPRYTPPPQTPEAGPVEVTVPEAATEMVTLRGPDGKLRSFPIRGGRAAIKTRTIVVRPGEQLHLTIRGGHVEVRNK